MTKAIELDDNFDKDHADPSVDVQPDAMRLHIAAPSGPGSAPRSNMVPGRLKNEAGYLFGMADQRKVA